MKVYNFYYCDCLLRVFIQNWYFNSCRNCVLIGFFTQHDFFNSVSIRLLISSCKFIFSINSEGSQSRSFLTSVSVITRLPFSSTYSRRYCKRDPFWLTWFPHPFVPHWTDIQGWVRRRSILQSEEFPDMMMTSIRNTYPDWDLLETIFRLDHLCWNLSTMGFA